jgi:hypothetical protein
MFSVSEFLWVRSLGRVCLGPLLQHFLQTAVTMMTKHTTIWKPNCGRTLPRVLVTVHGIQFLVKCLTDVTVPCWLLLVGTLSSSL